MIRIDHQYQCPTSLRRGIPIISTIHELKSSMEYLDGLCKWSLVPIHKKTNFHNSVLRETPANICLLIYTYQWSFASPSTYSIHDFNWFIVEMIGIPLLTMVGHWWSVVDSHHLFSVEQLFCFFTKEKNVLVLFLLENNFYFYFQ